MSTNPIPTIPDDQVKDFIDGTLRKDTPEEYVRQNIERRLVIELDFPPERIAVEFPIKIGSSTRRVDLAIFPEGAEHVQDSIELIIECKRDSIEPNAKKDGVGQLKSYISACPNAQWGMWTNGRFKAVYRLVRGEKGHFWEEPNDIPGADGDVEQVDRPTRDSLRHASADNLLFSFKTCHNHIYVTDGLQKGPAFFELLKVIFCKIHDERNFPSDLEFFATAKEKASQDGRLTVARRIGKIFILCQEALSRHFRSDRRDQASAALACLDRRGAPAIQLSRDQYRCKRQGIRRIGRRQSTRQSGRVLYPAQRSVHGDRDARHPFDAVLRGR